MQLLVFTFTNSSRGTIYKYLQGAMIPGIKIRDFIKIKLMDYLHTGEKKKKNQE
jgi:hypothetical protein